MSLKRLLCVATLLSGVAMVGTAGAQELAVRTAVIGDDPVFVLPSGDSLPMGESSVEGVNISVSEAAGVLSYRASIGERTYTAHVDAAGPPRWLVFSPARQRFEALSGTVRVELLDNSSLNHLLLELDATHGKAYPALGFALIELDRDTNPVDVVDRLAVDPRVIEASLQFEKVVFRPMPAPMNRTVSSLAQNVPPVIATDKDALGSYLYAVVEAGYSESGGDPLLITATVYNLGLLRSGATYLQLYIDESGPRQAWLQETRIVPQIDGKSSYQIEIPITLSFLNPDRTYYVVAQLREDGQWQSSGETGFSLDNLYRVQHTCIEPGRGSAADMADPLQSYQWHLENTGQTAFAASGGTADEDLQMDDVLDDGPTGEGVRVAIVDSGLEICHPDLRHSIEANASYNFNANLFGSASPWWFTGEVTDPFNFDSTGDHGTSVAGVIASAANNGIGGRGVAPDALLRGYNFLSAQSSVAFYDSLGASSIAPNSTDVDIFNMSFGGILSFPQNASADEESLFAHGVGSLRSGLGAIYVKAAGNGFGSCLSIERDVNAQIGCRSSIGSPTSNLPYVIVVGGFNADGERSSYSSAGANLWISAPAGEYGYDDPALVTTDPIGLLRGDTGGVSADSDVEAMVNPDGDYTENFNGSSAATASVSAAIAVLLEAEPELTWRDVKHVLAKTARRIDPDRAAVEERIGFRTRILQTAWVVNSAGYGFHNWYGFGALDLDAAVAFVDTYTPDSLGTFRQSGWFNYANLLSIPDDDGSGVSQSLTVSGLPASADIEAVILEVDIDHPFPNDLGIDLVSAQGTRSVVNPAFNETLAIDLRGQSRLRWRLLSNAFYGEDPNGEWDIEVYDAADGDTGQLNAWRLRFYYGDHPE